MESGARSGRAERSAVWNVAGSAGKWLLAAVLGAVIGACISDRYADRQRELELEASLVTQVSAGSIRLFQDAQKASRASTRSRRHALREIAADRWVLASGSITPVFQAYFGGQDVSDRWGEYQQAMYDWTVLGCCTTDEGRPVVLARVREYLDERIGAPLRNAPVFDPWAALNTATPRADLYQWLGFSLLRGRGKLLEDLRQSSPQLD